jgi:mono/diheme cytochrome c family protein
MNRWVKVGGATLAVLVLLAAGGVYGGLQLADQKMQRKVEVPVTALALPTDAASLDRGKYLFLSRGCVDCHGDNGAGRTFVEGEGLRIKGPNISPGPGSVVTGYRVEDWVRAIRHGVAPSGRPLMVMPSEDYNRFTDQDLSALVAYVRSLPPVTGTGRCPRACSTDSGRSRMQPPRSTTACRRRSRWPKA